MDERKIWPFSSAESDRDLAEVRAALLEVGRYLADYEQLVASRADPSAMDAQSIQYELEDLATVYAGLRRNLDDARVYGEDLRGAEAAELATLTRRIGDIDHDIDRRRTILERAQQRLEPASQHDWSQFDAAAKDALGFAALTPVPDIAGPQLSGAAPTEADLETATERVIEIETSVNVVMDQLQRVDDLASALNYHFDRRAASDGSDAGASAQQTYDAAVSALSSARQSLRDQHMMLQAQISAWSAARAKIEHDLQWQGYVADSFGVDPLQIEREVKLVAGALPDPAVEALAA